jgi:hypothetical protein
MSAGWPTRPGAGELVSRAGHGAGQRGGHRRQERAQAAIRRRSASPLRQWMLRITEYAERLLADLDGLDWSESIKEMQRNWIGKSEGAEVEFRNQGSAFEIQCSPRGRTRLFGATYMVLSPEHPLVDQITTPEQLAAVRPTRRPPRARATWSARSCRRTRRASHGRVRHQPGERGADPGLDRRLRALGLWHRRHHGRAGARHARSRVCAHLQPARPRGRAGAGGGGVRSVSLATAPR